MTIKEYCQQILSLTGLEENEAEINIEEEDERITVNLEIPEEKAGFYIGFRGETLDALQQVIRLTFRDLDKKIILDINQYKQEREQALLDKAERIAQELLETGRSFVFHNLNSYERFLIHDFIANDDRFADDLETFSEDKYNGRVLILQIKE